MDVYDLPTNTIEECLLKSREADMIGDYEVAHKAEDNALYMFVKHILKCEDNEKNKHYANLISTHLNDKKGSRWYA